MAVEVRLPTVLRSQAGGASVVSVDGGTVGEVLAKLVAEYPGLSGQVVQADGSLHKFVNLLRGRRRRPLSRRCEHPGSPTAPRSPSCRPSPEAERPYP